MDDSLKNFADLISVATVATCMFLKVPQIAAIRRKKSAEGLYIQAMIMEIIGSSITILYNFKNRYNPMTYLEYPIILCQVFVLLFYSLKYQNYSNSKMIPAGMVLYSAVVGMFLSEVLPKDVLSLLIPFCTPLSGAAKVSYIYGIIKAGNANSVSLTTWIISMSTNFTRLFTVYVDSADSLLMFNFFISTLLSAGVLVTAMHYKGYTMNSGLRRERIPSKRASICSECKDEQTHLHRE